ncbi:hypothetical protein AX16_009930 [Volvariella volvacea WC 439]|nr:hypothetical protein AX16_009930 [Volvariella volvacea WC 439]
MRTNGRARLPNILHVVTILTWRAWLVDAKFCEDSSGNKIPGCWNPGPLIGAASGIFLLIVLCSIAFKLSRRRYYQPSPPPLAPIYNNDTQDLYQQGNHLHHVGMSTTPQQPSYSYNVNYSPHHTHHTHHHVHPSLAEPRYHGVGPAPGTATYSPYSPPAGPPPPAPAFPEPPPPHPAHAGGVPTGEILTPPPPAFSPHGPAGSAVNPPVSPPPQGPPPSYSV